MVLFFSCTKEKKINVEKISDKEILNRKINEYKKNYENYASSKIVVRFDSLLLLSRLKYDKDFVESDFILKKTDSLFYNFSNKNNYLLNDINKFIDSLNLSKSDINYSEIEFLKNQIFENSNLNKKNFETDSIVLHNSKEIINLLKECDVKFSEQNIIFENTSCLKKYNALISKIQTTILSSSLESMNYRFSKKTNLN